MSGDNHNLEISWSPFVLPPVKDSPHQNLLKIFPLLNRRYAVPIRCHPREVDDLQVTQDRLLEEWDRLHLANTGSNDGTCTLLSKYVLMFRNMELWKDICNRCLVIPSEQIKNDKSLYNGMLVLCQTFMENLAWYQFVPRFDGWEVFDGHYIDFLRRFDQSWLQCCQLETSLRSLIPYKYNYCGSVALAYCLWREYFVSDYPFIVTITSNTGISTIYCYPVTVLGDR